MKKEEIAIELTKIFVEQGNVRPNLLVLNKQDISETYKYFLSEIEEKEDK